MPLDWEYRWFFSLCAASVSLSTAISGEGRSGLPKPKSMTSAPPRRASCLRPLMTPRTYGGMPLMRRNSMPPRVDGRAAGSRSLAAAQPLQHGFGVGHDAVEELLAARQVVDHADDLARREHADVGAALDQRPLGEHG